jgi:drug/metabolite transporter (DMT)-like permease
MSSTGAEGNFISPKRAGAATHLKGKTVLMIVIMVICGPLGNILLGKGMRAFGDVTAHAPSEALELFTRVMTSALIWLGILSLITFFVAYMLVLSWADYSYVQPASSIAYVVVALLGHFVLHEFVSPVRWLGVSIICLGVMVVSQTPPRTTQGDGPC